MSGLSLLAVTTVCGLVAGSASCNHFQENPTGYCRAMMYSGSNKYVCIDGAPHMKSYTTDDCSGTVTNDEDLSSSAYYNGLGWECAADDTCEYTVQTDKYYGNSCGGEALVGTTGLILDQCFTQGDIVAVHSYTCSGGKLQYLTWDYAPSQFGDEDICQNEDDEAYSEQLEAAGCKKPNFASTKYTCGALSASTMFSALMCAFAFLVL